MDERRMLAVLTLVLALQCVAAMFFHAPSSVILQGLEAENNSDFGFSMVYMDDIKTLVVGAPKADKIGKVFNCEMGDAEAFEIITCVEKYIGIDPSWYNTEQFPEQRFHLGATIVAHDDYFFTCAPLWTTKINAIDKSGKIKLSDTFGTCFVQNDTETHRYHGFLEKYENHRVNFQVDEFNGGTGWSTLIDKDNDVLLMTKTATFSSGDIFYLPASKPCNQVKSLNQSPHTPVSRYMSRYWNIGFGLTAGKFFTGETMYAISVLQRNMEGLILFLTYRKDNLRLLALTGRDANRNNYILVSNKAVGSMFGTTMSAADLNMDGLDELLVGAPAQSEDECVECGALHIYIGGDMKTITERKRIRSIFGNAELGRFGTAIAAKDLDGDGKSELVVSAPYENHGSGAIYILSGYELYNTLMKTQDYKSIQLSELKLKQKIHKESYRALGFSLQFVTDVDENACDELAASSPDSSRVLLFKCVQKINVTMSSHLIGEQTVREQDKFFTVEVCARVELPAKLPVDIVGNITINNSIIGEAAIVLQPNVVIDISCFICARDRKNLCKNVTVELTDKEPADYTFISKAVLQNHYLSDPNMTEFNSTWVETSPYSKLEASLDVSRHCKGDDCKPDLSMNITWSGSKRYLLGSSANETAKIKVTNIGNASYSSCVWLKVTGAPLTRVDCEAYQEGYRCYMPKPLRRDTDYDIDLQLNMTRPTNEHEDLIVEVYLYENCNQESVNKSAVLEIPFDLPSEGVFNDGDLHKLNITDKQILDDAIVYDHHEYPIRNNGTITWKRVNFTVSMQKTLTQHYINSFTVSVADLGECEPSKLADSSFIIHHCILDLPPNTTQIVIGTTEIFAGRLSNYVNGAELNMISTSQLFLSVRLPVLQTPSNTKITIQKEITIGNRKWLIALIAGIVALILLIILTIVLYKCGFFRRKQKQVLLVAKESVRRKSIRRDTHASAMDGPVEGLQMDVDDDSPFEEARPVTTKDNVGLVVNDEP